MPPMNPPDATAETILQVAQTVACTEAEGPGKRYALWFQGCPLRCPGCCNPEFLAFRDRPRPLADIVAELETARSRSGIEGITLLGGEPLAYAAGSVALAQIARDRGLSVMVFTGYTLEQAEQLPDPAVRELLRLTDILVDGPYDRDRPDTTRRWIGSTNQRIHFLTTRYHADDPCWRQRNTLELRLVGGELSLNGFPAPAAVGLWKGLKPLTPRG